MGFDKIPGIIKDTWDKIQKNNQEASGVIANIAEYTNKVDLGNSMISNPSVLAERVLKRSAISASITIPVKNYNDYGKTGYTATIPFYMTGDFNFSMGNKWEDALDLSGLQDLAKFINQMHMTVGEGEAQVSMQSEAMSTQIWKGSTFEGFDIDCLFVCTNRDLNTLKILNILTATCLPTRYSEQKDAANAGFKNAHDVANGLIDFGAALGSGIINGLGQVASAVSNQKFDTSGAEQAVSDLAEGGKQYIDGMGLIAPLNYGLRKGNDGSAATEDPLPNTTVTLQIGDYFRADNLLVESLSGVTLSKEIIGPKTAYMRGGDLYHATSASSDYGFPLYLKCHLKLKPHSMMHFKKWQGYFKTKDGIANAISRSYGDFGGNSYEL